MNLFIIEFMLFQFYSKKCILQTFWEKLQNPTEEVFKDFIKTVENLLIYNNCMQVFLLVFSFALL
jgi:hypothetical protein